MVMNLTEEQFVIFRLGKEEYAIDISQVREIIQYKNATKIPDTPQYMDGIINLRGIIIPIIELTKKFHLIPQDRGEGRAIIIEVAGRKIGIVVDEVTAVIRLSEAAIEPAPGMMMNKYVRGIGKSDGRLLILLALDQLFPEVDLAAITT
jgi:purine-binding chemotaxis protein CheW